MKEEGEEGGSRSRIVMSIENTYLQPMESCYNS